MTEIKHEYGYWIVFVNDDPKFSFMYREEAKSVADMIDALIVAKDEIDKAMTKTDHITYNDKYTIITNALTKAGVEL